MTQVLLLGAGGFLGRPVARALQEAPDFTLKVAPRRSALDLLSAHDADWNRLLLDPVPDVIINAAGRTSGTLQEVHEDNTLLVATLLRHLKRLRLTPWLVQFGSAAEYGPTDRAPVPESFAGHPASSYAQSKFDATQLLLRHFGSGEARGVTLRIFNPVGAGQGPQTLPGQAALKFRQALLDGAETVAFGPLDSARDFVNLRDVTAAALFAARLEQGPPVLNIGSGQATLARDLVRDLARLAGYRGEITEQAPPSARSAAVLWQQADLRTAGALGWSPVFTLGGALEDLWHSLPPTFPTHKETPHGSVHL
ncbi:NAD(P)-dependent oxidoreductase [Deinococcus depolymerans]|uniref:NAD(P)-dependent oxidoreductase n=1 Tax=Deinococcus depolymerans TaxID=392408 RepID=A0ABN1C9V2_9DEIO